MACKFDEMANNVIAASSKQDDFKIIEIGTNEIKHEIRDIMSPTLAIDVTENVNKLAFGTKHGDMNFCTFGEPQT